MSWNKIKTFLIILFLIINAYLIHSGGGFETLFFNSYTTVDEDVLNKTASIIKKNYDIDVNIDSIPKKVNNLTNINVINLIYTDKFDSADYAVDHNYKDFTILAETDTYSYNEVNAEDELKKILSDIGLVESSYQLTFSKNDSGLSCSVYGCIDKYMIFNNYIKAKFASRKISLSGSWHLPESSAELMKDSNIKLQSVTTFLMDAAYRMSTESSEQNRHIKEVGLGYFVSYYDEQAVNKSATAIPCYVVETDIGYKYYYDALNGNYLKMEE